MHSDEPQRPGAAREAHAQLLDALRGLGLLGAREPSPPVTALRGGVSSDILRVDLAQGPVCVKRALARLRVAADWQAPVARNRFEAAWYRTVAGILPAAVPRLLGEAPEQGLFVMQYFDPRSHPLWKARLREGLAEPEAARAVGAGLALIHARTAGSAALAAAFASDDIFQAIRLEPYLEATAERHPRLAGALLGLAETTRRQRLALVHGDVSPKNILLGPRGPVFLDAECAWYGDPAFDLAFCLNHLLLKCLWVPRARAGFLACFDALAGAYLSAVAWEPVARFEARAAHLLPGLLLARVDGKSPVEYLDDERARARVRRAAGDLLERPRARLGEVRAAWERELDA